jgi:hypothetical protein
MRLRQAEDHFGSRMPAFSVSRLLVHNRYPVRAEVRPLLAEEHRQSLRTPDGQISNVPVHPRSQKYRASVLSQITCISASVSFPLGGTYRDRHGRWEWDAVDEAMSARGIAARTSDVACGRRSRVVLTPRRWRQVGR